MRSALDDDYDFQQPIYVIADQGTRLANGIIDTFIALFIVSSICNVLLFFLVGRDVQEDLGFYIVFIYYFAYFYVSEGYFDGKTIGKLITKTRAIQLDGEPMSRNTLLKRSLLRCIPFDCLSFLGNSGERGWHDRFSQTTVVKEIPQESSSK